MTTATASKARSTPNLPARLCPQCGINFKPTHGRQRFCCSAHKLAFEVTARQRGAILEAFVLTWRQGKNGKTEDTAYALQQLSKMADKWNAEDKAKGRNASRVVAQKRRDNWDAADLGA